MSDQLTPPFSDFEQQVHDCLTHLYDFMFLQDHPLVGMLVPEITGPNRIQVFREIIINCVENLRPNPELETQAKVSRLYNILRLRYIRQQTVQQVILNLSLSERQFYRDLPKAIQIVSRMLSERPTGESAEPEAVESDEEALSVQSEVQRARTELTSTRIEIKSLIDGALYVTQSLIDQYQVRITNCTTNDISISDSDRTILRQILIVLFSQLMLKASDIKIESEVVDRYCQITFIVHRREAEAAGIQSIRDLQSGQETLGVLIENIEGKFSTEAIDNYELHLILEIPLRQVIVLVIDDNPHIVSLFRRYLTGQPFHLITTAEGSKAIELARRIQPQLIILDVMLPGQDGWEILQYLKNNPATLSIPILVCSVLDLPDVAISLGADAYLKKTPGQAEFLKALVQWSA